MKNPFISNKYLILIYRIILIILCFWGLYLNFNLSSYKLMPLISYFTIISNILCLLYFVTKTIQMLLKFSDYNNQFNSLLKGTVIMCLIVTFLVFHFVLRPMSLGMINAKYFMSLANIITHYLVPILVLIDWLLFDVKGQLKYIDSFKWLLFPFMYWIGITIRGILGFTYYDGSNYPYFFLDLEKYGLFIILRNIIFIGLIFVFLGLIFITLDKFIFNIKIKGNLHK